MRICFVSETSRGDQPILDPSVRYRCYHPAEFLVELGHQCVVLSAKQFYANPSFLYDIYIFHRPSLSRHNFVKILTEIKKTGAKVLADYDDIIFGDESIALISSSVKNGTLTEEVALQVYANNLGALLHFDHVITSTGPLMEYAQKFNPSANVHVVPNMLPPSVTDIQKKFGTHLRKRSLKRIGYFAGTKSHDKDILIVEDVLHKVLSENRDFNLLVLGPVSIPFSLSTLPNVTSAPVTSFYRLPSIMSQCSTVIAPLERSVFNDCKSRVKYLESALTGCKLIATPIPDMKAIGSDNMILAETKNDWYNALSAIDDKASSEYYRDQGQKFIDTFSGQLMVEALGI